MISRHRSTTYYGLPNERLPLWHWCWISTEQWSCQLSRLDKKCKQQRKG